MTEREYWYWLCNISVLGARKIKKLIEVFETPENLFKEEEEKLVALNLLTEKESTVWMQSKKDIIKLQKQLEQLCKVNVTFVTQCEEVFPERLKSIYDCPYGLYVKGRFPQNHIPTAAIIGARSCSEYGREMAKKISRELSKAGIQIISGMASGIDGAGHRGAMEARGLTFGILGCGVDICYPFENIELYEYMQIYGGIISEFPIGSQPLPYHFPIRNRIISGLSDVVIVIEAKERSGSFITVDSALEQGKEIFALPGRISDSLSKGCNELIKNGAGILTAPRDILDYFHIQEKKENRILEHQEMLLTEEERRIVNKIDLQPIHLQEIIDSLGLESRSVINVLLKLELSGIIKQSSKNYYIKN